jgi:hypothetical protein
MIHLSFTKDDFKRVVWTFAQVVVATAVVGVAAQSQVPRSVDDAKQVAIGIVLAAVAAGISAVKNLLLADGSGLK